MDPESLPSDERSRSAREFPCPYCGVKAGTRCRTTSGEYYKEWTYVHIDRLITMYRDAFVNRATREVDEWHAGYQAGRGSGWKDGVLDARYTFENTPILRGCRDEGSLEGALELECGVPRVDRAKLPTRWTPALAAHEALKSRTRLHWSLGPPARRPSRSTQVAQVCCPRVSTVTRWGTDQYERPRAEIDHHGRVWNPQIVPGLITSKAFHGPHVLSDI